MGFDVGGVDHLRVRGSSTSGQFPEQVLPQPATRPTHEAVIDRRRRTILGRAIAPAAPALENMHDPADDPPIINPLNAAHIGRQMRLNPRPLLVAQPKQIPAHDPDPLPKTNQDRIVHARKLMSSDPNDGFAADRSVFRRSQLRCAPKFRRVRRSSLPKAGGGWGFSAAKRPRLSPNDHSSTVSTALWFPFIGLR